MRLVHLSDLHLGYRQYQRLTPGGVNQREADVAATFRVAIDRIIAIAPDLVLVAGDIFHSVRPTNQAILHAFMQFSRLVRSLPEAIVVLIAGNHDTPRSSDTGGILQLLAQLGLYVVDREARRLSFADRDLSILAIPSVAGPDRPALIPDPEARFNVLLVHGEVQGALPASATLGDPAAIQISPDELRAARWDYVALGHYHVYHEVGSNAFYSGSIEYTSLNPWGDQREEGKREGRDAGTGGKGFIERDLITGRHEFHSLRAARALIDLPPINARGLTAAEVDERIHGLVDAIRGGIDDKIVRLTVWDAARHIARELDHKTIREYKRRALNFHLDIRRPDVFRLHASGAPGGRPTIELKEIVAQKLRFRTLAPEIDRDALIARAIAYIDEAHATGVAPAALLET